MASEIELIKSKVDIVDFLKSYITLIPAGKNFKAPCPFHNERTASFIVSPERQIWHCFGSCGDGGDVIRFAMKIENLEFREALRFLAERAGLVIPSLSQGEDRAILNLYDIYESAKDFYAAELHKNKSAIDYLLGRGLTLETIKEFELGLSPNSESLVLHLTQNKFNILDCGKGGLVHKNLRGLYQDRFAYRIIFPIYNSLGRVVAFTGRLLRDIPDSPKYLNSPETPIFNKSKILYGLHKTKQAISKSKTVFFVEGQMDFLLAYQVGIKNIVAVSGTGLTRDHLATLRRFSDTAILSFDNDEAGMKALERSLDPLNSFDFHTKVIDLGEYKDPADAAKANPKFLETAINNAKPAFQHIFNYYFRRPISDISEKKRTIRHLLSHIRTLTSAVEQSTWIKELSRLAGIGESALFLELENLPKETVSDQELQSKNSQKKDEQSLSRIDLIASRVLTLAFGNESLLKDLEVKVSEIPEKYQHFIKDPNSEKGGLLRMKATFEMEGKSPKDIKSEFENLLQNLELEHLKQKQEVLKENLRLANSSGDEAKIQKLMEEYNQISKLLQSRKVK